MDFKKIEFSVEVNNMVITSGTYGVFLGIVKEHYGVPATQLTPFDGNSFSIKLLESNTYLAVTVYIKTYTINGDPNTYTVTGNPIAMLATFHLPSLAAGDVVKVCPESSIASIYTFAQMTTFKADGIIKVNGDWRNLNIAYGMKQNIFLTKGGVAAMIQNPPNGFETNSYPMFNSLCNLFYYCLTDTAFYAQFLDYAWHETDKPNNTFLEAVRNMVYDPFTRAREIYDMLAQRDEIYPHSLTTMPNVPDDKKAPNNWTLTLKTNSSGSKNFIPSGAAFVVFDANDNAWVANNFRAGSNVSGTHCMVYKCDATPAGFSPVQGGGLLGVAFGAAVTPDKKYVSFGNFGWGPELNNPQEGSISQFKTDGAPLSPSNGYTVGLSRVQGMQYDSSGNLWMASVGCQDPFAPAPTGVYPFASAPSAVVVYLHNADSNGVPLPPDEAHTLILDKFPVKKTFESQPETIRTPYLKIFDVAPDNKGNAYVSCIGNYDSENPGNCALSTVYKVAIEGNALVVKAAWYSDFKNDADPTAKRGYESLRQVTVTAKGDVIVVGVTSSRATVLTADLQPKQTGGLYYDTNTNAPWGIKIDKRGTVFLANFGEEKDRVGDYTLDMNGPFGVTMLRNTSDPRTAKLLTVPSGGQQVMLANGHPLYGTQTRPAGGKLEPVTLPCYEPIMRLTATNIDGAGNLWCMNNWKPAKAIDIANNPGGDGVVIFLGIATPE